MQAAELRRRYIDFFVNHAQHAEIAGASLLPENDPTVLFTTAGMQPLVPYLMGEPHPAGKRLVDVQKCMRTDDIEEVGDNTHFTFFEMLGNWSLGDYFKKESITWSYEFLTNQEIGLGLNSNMLAVSVFEGDNDAPRDEESANYWLELGIPFERIAYLPKSENWWGPAGQTGPCGPDTEIFYWTGEGDAPSEFDPEDNNWVEIWNNVFMQYDKQVDGTFKPLEQKCVDTGMGLERMTCIMQGVKTPYETELFTEVIDEIKSRALEYNNVQARIIADHLRSSVFVIGDPRGVTPGNTDQAYVLRRLIRRAVRAGRKMGIESPFICDLAGKFVHLYAGVYPELVRSREHILNELRQEEEQFTATLHKGEREFEKMIGELSNELPGDLAFKLYDTFGFPIEMTQELAAEHDMKVDMDGYQKAYAAHQELSRKGAEQKFAGGLADHSEETTRLHTATHLLHQALRDVLGEHVQQKGSNITKDRLRFDFNHDDKMTPEEIAAVEKIVNEQISRDLPINCEEMTVEQAKADGAIGLFEDKYATLGEKIKVYRMGDFSLEICGGPHAKTTGELGSFKIKKEESSSRGVRRIKAVITGA